MCLAAKISLKQEALNRLLVSHRQHLRNPWRVRDVLLSIIHLSLNAKCVEPRWLQRVLCV